MEWPGKWLRRRESKRQHHASRGREVDTTDLGRVESFVRDQQQRYFHDDASSWDYCADDDEVYYGQ